MTPPPATDVAGAAVPIITAAAPCVVGIGEEDLEQLNDLAEALRLFAQGGHVGPPLQKLSVATIHRKRRALERYGVAGLLRKTRADRGAARVGDARTIARVQAAYLQPHQPSAASIYKDIARDYEISGQKPPSYSFVRRAVGGIDADLVTRFRCGERAWDDTLAYVTLRKKPALPRQWCDADHHLIDHVVIFSDGSIGRPWLTAIQDIATNEITGYTLSREKRSTYPGSQTIALTLRQAILKKDDPAWPSFGLFESFYSDLGRDFRSQHVRAVCADLGIDVRFARGYHGKSKPIERFFGTLEGQLKHLPGYVGRSPETNPLKQSLGAPRAWEDLRGEILTIEQFGEKLRGWIVNTFHHAESRSLKGLSPIAALEAHVKNGWSARAVAKERDLDLLMMSRAGKTVQRFGIQLFSSSHTQRFFMAPELVDLIGHEVQVFWNPEKIGEIVVYKDSRFVCTAQNRELLEFGATEEDLRGERDLKRRQRESTRARFDELQKQAQYPDPLARAQAEKRLAKVEHEEREKIAVNAQAPAVATILPQFQQAAKRIAAVQRSKVQGSTSDRGSAGGAAPLTYEQRKARRAAREDEAFRLEQELFAPLYDPPAEEELKSSDEIFKPVE